MTLPPIVYTIPVLVDSKINLENSGVLIPDGMIAKVAGSDQFKIGQGDKTWNELEFVSSESSNGSVIGIASVDKVGLVKPDGTTITVDADGALKRAETGSTKTLSAPAIIISEKTVLAGDPVEIIITERPINITEVSRFLIYVNETLLTAVNAVGGRATYTLTIPSTAGTLHLSVYAEDVLGNRSAATVDQIVIKTSTVNAPAITSPANNAAGVSRKPTITWSEFSDTAGLDTKAAVQVQVSTDSNFNDIVYDSGESTELDTSVSLELELELNTLYYIGVRYKGVKLGWGEWGFIEFTTVSNQAPTGIITVTGSTTVFEKSTGNTLSFSGVTDPEGDVITYSISQSDSATLTFSKTSNITSGENVTFTAPDVTTDTTIIVTVTSQDSFGNNGPTTSFAVTVKVVIISTSSITSPTANSTVAMESGELTLVSSKFSSTDNLAAHSTSDWKVTTDSVGNTVKVQALGSTDKTSHKFTGIDVTDKTALYCWVKHNSSNYGNSTWSSGVKITASSYSVAPSSRKFYRHSSGKGTVMEYNDGTAHKMLVLDAAFRKTWVIFSKTVWITKLTKYSSTSKEYLSSSQAITSATNTNTKNRTDSWINSNIVKDSNTAKANCNVWITFKGAGVDAVEWCRKQSVGSLLCDLPNIQQLARIYCDAVYLDAMDPTASANSALKLWGGIWSSSSTKAWSSTEHASGSSSDAYPGTNWSITYQGRIEVASRDEYGGVIPILEL